MGVGDDPVGRDREAAAMAEVGDLAILEGDDDDAHDERPAAEMSSARAGEARASSASRTSAHRDIIGPDIPMPSWTMACAAALARPR